jgi:DNA-binding CsgD family transcriptional regulator
MIEGAFLLQACRAGAVRRGGSGHIAAQHQPRGHGQQDHGIAAEDRDGGGRGEGFAGEDSVVGQGPPKAAPAVRSKPDAVLTSRQPDIARLVADDLTNSQIAARLFLSERTVETHITNIFNKLGLNSRIQLSRWVADATEQG